MASAQTLHTAATTHPTTTALPTGRTRARALTHRLLATDAAAAPAVARVALAVILFPHGAQHALGWFGGYGFAGTYQWMTATLGFPGPLAALAIVVELLAPLALLVGLGGRLAALGLFGLMVGAASTHLSDGFFMNWFGALKPGQEGFEYHLLVMALAAVVVLAGSGALSLDRRLAATIRAA
jgi:putative oxidoreductase